MIVLKTRVADIVRENPASAGIFEAVGIDYCCGGGVSLIDACKQKGLDPAMVTTLLNAPPPLTKGRDLLVDDYSTQDLIRHIVDVHHGFLRTELPRIRNLVQKVAQAHGAHDPRLAETARVFDTLVEELLPHQDTEEQEVFPKILDAEHGDLSVVPALEDLIREHEAVGGLFRRLRELTDDYQVREWACPSTIAMLKGLVDIEEDTHRHIHKENFILFPRCR